MSIYVEFEKPETPREFLKKFFSWNRGCDISAVRTFYDKNCTATQCKAGLIRSFDNILECIRTYFPEVNAKDLMEMLLTLDIKDSLGHQCDLYMMNCEDIERINCYYATYDSRYGDIIDMEQYDSDYSWEELLEMVGIKSQRELDEFKSNKF